jgi:hypothetical protein
MADDRTKLDTKRAIRHLRQFVEALDRRVPHIERVGEAQIADDAAALKEKALRRIAQLEGRVKSGEAIAPAAGTLIT